jgi:lipopolysaccharide export system permease protein
MFILKRYTLREFFSALFFGLFVFVFVLLLDKLFYFISVFLHKEAKIYLIIKLFYSLLPTLLSLALPMAILFALLYVFSRFSEDNEIIALQVNGIRIRAIVLPLLFLSFLVALLLIPFNTQIVPESHYRFEKTYAQIVYHNPGIRLEEKNSWAIGNYRLWIEKIENKELKNIILYEFPEDKQPIRIIARKGKYILPDLTNLILNLEDGNIQYYDFNQPGTLSRSDFKTYKIIIPLPSASQPIVSKSLREMKSDELYEEIKKYRQQNISTSYLEVEYYLRIVLAVTPFIFALLAIPLGIKIKHGGRAIGFGVSLLVIFFYYLLIVFSIILGEKKILPPFLSLWIPNFLLFVIGVTLFYRLSKY